MRGIPEFIERYQEYGYPVCQGRFYPDPLDDQLENLENRGPDTLYLDAELPATRVWFRLYLTVLGDQARTPVLRVYRAGRTPRTGAVRWHTVTALTGKRLRMAMPAIASWLRRAGQRDDLPYGRHLKVHGVDGARIALLGLVLAGVRDAGQIERVIAGVEELAEEEVWYWLGKCGRGRRARKALRVLLGAQRR